MSIYKAGFEVFYTVFDATDSTKENWIERSRILESSTTDITTAFLKDTYSIFFTLEG